MNILYNYFLNKLKVKDFQHYNYIYYCQYGLLWILYFYKLILSYRLLKDKYIQRFYVFLYLYSFYHIWQYKDKCINLNISFYHIIHLIKISFYDVLHLRYNPYQKHLYNHTNLKHGFKNAIIMWFDSIFNLVILLYH